jgi:hypothetical protein
MNSLLSLPTELLSPILRYCCRTRKDADEIQVACKRFAQALSREHHFGHTIWATIERDELLAEWKANLSSLGLDPESHMMPEPWDRAAYSIVMDEFHQRLRSLTDEENDLIQTPPGLRRFLTDFGLPTDAAEKLSRLGWDLDIPDTVHVHMMKSLRERAEKHGAQPGVTRFCLDGRCGLCGHKDERRLRKMCDPTIFVEAPIRVIPPGEDMRNFQKSNMRDPRDIFKERFPSFRGSVKAGWYNGNRALVLEHSSGHPSPDVPRNFAGCKVRWLPQGQIEI